MTSPLPTDRLKVAVEEKQVYNNVKSLRGIDSNIQTLINQRADCAARLLELEPWVEKAREVLRELEWVPLLRSLDGNHVVLGCPSCFCAHEYLMELKDIIGEDDISEFDVGHAPDCAIAELLKEDQPTPNKPFTRHNSGSISDE